MTSISQYFSGKTVFVTGGTGTVGKVVLWKLLQSCSDVKKIFILLRPKLHAGSLQKDRLNHFINEPVFENIRKNNPIILGKIVAVDGDLEEPGLGINGLQSKQLLSEVQVVIHMGANVKFDLPLNQAMKVNFGGTCELLELFSKSTQDLMFLYVSTLFLQPDDVLEERVYELGSNYHQVEKLMYGKYGEEAQRLEKELLQGKSNSYIFSKTAAECAVKGFEYKFRVSILRLPIVGPCLKEPVPGFMDTKLTFSAFFLAGASGVLPYSLVKRRCVADIVPADLCANAIIAEVWHRANQDSNKSASVLNLSSEHSFTWGNFADAGNAAAKKYPAKNIMWYPRTRLINSMAWFKVVTLIFMYLPAMFLDLAAIFSNHPPKSLPLLFKIQHGLHGFRNFSNRNWKFSKHNMRMLQKKLSRSDALEFPVLEEKINLSNYMDTYGQSARKYVFKLEEKDIADCTQALRRSVLLEVFRYSFVPLLISLLALYAIAVHYTFSETC